MNALFGRRGGAPGALRHGLPLCLSLAAAAPAGCVGVEAGFHCDSNAQCVSADGQQGVCEAAGYCGFPDSACEGTERRHGEAAPEELAGQCVAPPSGVGCVAQIAAGGRHTCVIKKDDSVWCWGDNSLGQLGDGTVEARSGPVQVVALAGNGVAEISGGIDHTCARTGGGDVYCWGDNLHGQLGVVDPEGMKVPGGGVPRKVEGLPPTKSISAGGKHTCVVEQAGLVWCFGENGTYQLGDGTTDERPAPVKIDGVDNIAVVQNGDEHTCAQQQDGLLWCWGSNSTHQLGVADVADSGQPLAVKSLNSVKQLAVGDEHTCILKQDTTVWCWGYNGSGCVGYGPGPDQAVPLKVFSARYIALNGSAFHSCAIAGNEGEIWCWGSNEHGQIGDGTSEQVAAVPTPAKLVTASDVVVGGGHTCALTGDGTLWCWGDNTHHELGGGSDQERSNVPVRVPICP